MIVTALIIALTVTASMEVGRKSAENKNEEKIARESLNDNQYKDEILKDDKNDKK